MKRLTITLTRPQAECLRELAMRGVEEYAIDDTLRMPPAALRALRILEDAMEADGSRYNRVTPR